MTYKNNIIGQIFQNHKLANTVLWLQALNRSLVIKIDYFKEQEIKQNLKSNTAKRFQNSNKLFQSLSTACYGQFLSALL